MITNPELARQHARVVAARARIHAGLQRAPVPEPALVVAPEPPGGLAAAPVQHVRDYRRVLRARGAVGPRPSDVIEVVAETWRVPADEVAGPSREARCVRPRQAAMYVCRRYSARPLVEIARGLGRSDHTTVLHGWRVVATDVDRDPDGALARRIRACLRRLGLDGAGPVR